MEKNNNNDKEINLRNLINDIIDNAKVKNNLIIETNELTWEQTTLILDDIANKYKIPIELASVGVFQLMLKGASNSSTPDTLTITLNVDNKKIVEIKKYELLASYRSIMGNKYLRRLAEKLGPDICKYAENAKIPGDLANKINNRELSRGNDPLTDKEKAYCNSFMQNNKILEIETPKIQKLLAEDFNIKFKGNDINRIRPYKNEPPRPRRKGGKKSINKTRHN